MKDKQDPDDIGKQAISFAPRFFLDIGKRTLLKSYFAILGQPVDERSLQELMMVTLTLLLSIALMCHRRRERKKTLRIHKNTVSVSTKVIVLFG